MCADNKKQPPFDLSEHVGELFQAMTWYRRGISGCPVTFQKGTKTIQLENSRSCFTASLRDCLENRRSIRDYSSDPVEIEVLAHLLWATQGKSAQQGDNVFKTAPSAGALYPVELWTAVFDVPGVEPGIYRYDESQHCLQALRIADFRSEFLEACMNQKMIQQAPLLFLWIAKFNDCAWRYSQRAYRYVYLDAAHSAQNCALACSALGLGSCMIGAFYDDLMDHICGLDGEQQSVIYAASVGYPADE